MLLYQFTDYFYEDTFCERLTVLENLYNFVIMKKFLALVPGSIS